MKKVKEFFCWLFADWHISYIAVGFFSTAYNNTEGNLLQMLLFSEYYSDYLLGGLLVELVLRYRVIFRQRTIIPK